MPHRPPLSSNRDAKRRRASSTATRCLPTQRSHSSPGKAEQRSPAGPERQGRMKPVAEAMPLPPPRFLDSRTVDLRHGHHPVERTFRFVAARRQRLGQHARRDLPRYAPSVLTPAARTLLPAIADDGVPVAGGLGLIIRGDLEGEGFALLESETAIEAETGNPCNFEFNGEHIALLAGWVVAGRTMNSRHRADGKGFGIKTGGRFGIFVVPETDRVLRHCMSSASSLVPYLYFSSRSRISIEIPSGPSMNAMRMPGRGV